MLLQHYHSDLWRFTLIWVELIDPVAEVVNDDEEDGVSMAAFREGPHQVFDQHLTWLSHNNGLKVTCWGIIRHFVMWPDLAHF